MIDKHRTDIAGLVAQIPDGATLGIGGFGDSGSPTRLLRALLDSGRTDLHIVSNNLGADGTAYGRLLEEGRIRKFTGSFPAGPAIIEPLLSGRIELELVPQGTLAERLRAAGTGILGFYTRTSAHTVLATGQYPSRYDAAANPVAYPAPKPTREFDGVTAVLEEALPVDFAFVKAHRADRIGNLQFRLAARNFNPLVGMAAATTLVETEHYVPAGAIPPAEVHLPGIYVDAIISHKDAE